MSVLASPPQNALAPGTPALYLRRSDKIARRAHTRLIWTVGLGLALFTTWAALTSLERITRGSGRVVPQTRNQIVQHFEGGIVSEILVREGQNVRAGAPLLRIENSFSRAELEQNRVELKAKRLQAARLDAEAAGLTRFDPPEDIARAIPSIRDQEIALFKARMAGLNAQIAVMEDQYRQKELELAEMKSRWTSSLKEREIVLPRVTSMRRLEARGAVSNNELLDNERSLQQIEAKIASLVHDVPRLEAAVSELAARKTEARLHFRADAEKDRREIAVQIAKLEEAINAMSDRSRRSEVVAPVAGIVNKLFVETIGGVVKSGEPLVQLVPADAPLVVEARLAPNDRANVWPGLPAVIKVSAYDFALYGGLRGKVLDISPDALSDEKGEPYFRVRLEAQSTSFGLDKPVIPGMQAQVDIISGEHSVLAYLFKPIQRLRENALRQ
ncbi:MAG: HlyD family type I secretion periplasmic adaptor subunit [Proteobacteria bacterium]|nr:HlyD family type I secretion periplasmic adaptor subunit [Pseudomonadota bacterium]